MLPEAVRINPKKFATLPFPFVTLNLRLVEGVVEAPGAERDPRLTLFG
ncbi:hypothetical protein YIM73518_22680 [Thermus brockianus]